MIDSGESRISWPMFQPTNHIQYLATLDALYLKKITHLYERQRSFRSFSELHKIYCCFNITQNFDQFVAKVPKKSYLSHMTHLRSRKIVKDNNIRDTLVYPLPKKQLLTKYFVFIFKKLTYQHLINDIWLSVDNFAQSFDYELTKSTMEWAALDQHQLRGLVLIHLYVCLSVCPSGNNIATKKSTT